MRSLPPTLLVDNQYDRVFLYPAAVVDASSSQEDREPWRVVDARRERSYWQPQTDAEHWIRSTLGVGNEASADFWWLDRGHNRWGTTIYQEFGATGAAWPMSLPITLPPLNGGRIPVGGDPFSPSGAVTEEGACYGFFAKTGPWLYRRTRFPALGGGQITTIPGLMVGLRHQFHGFSTIYDPDASERTEIAGESQVGYQAVAQTYSWRVLELSFTHIGREEYLSRIRLLYRWMFQHNQVCYALPNAGDDPTLGGLFRYSGRQWSAPTNRVYRTLRFRLREVGARVD